MAANYTLLEKITVGAAGASSVTFSGIPQTGYTDLVVKITGRTTRVAVQDYVKTSFNGVTANLSMRQLYANGGSPASSAETEIYTPGLPGASATANTFGNVEIYIPNYTSSNYKSVSIDGVLENNAAGAYLALDAGLWSDTAAITSVVLTPYFGSFVQYSTFYLYGVAALGTTPVIVPYATGGDTIMTDGSYWYHSFISSGTFTPAKAITCDYLVVAGGGGGGGSYGGGGGGAGAFRTSIGGSPLSLAASAYTVTVGAGGAGTTGQGANGTDSVFSTITSTQGGGGAVFSSGVGNNGGSGGGGSNATNAGGTGTTGGNNGGAGSTGSSGQPSGGGGGGANAVGSAGGFNTGGNGGNGLSSSISGTSTTYAGGGGGSPDSRNTVSAGTGGTGGGGAGSTTGSGANGTANTGGGGGGSALGVTGTGGTGGSGIVIVRYAV